MMLFAGSTRPAARTSIATALILITACPAPETIEPDDVDDVPADRDLEPEPTDDHPADPAAPDADPVDEDPADSSGGAPDDDEPTPEPEPQPEPPVVPECGDGLVEGAEECEINYKAPLCELDTFACVWRRFVFVSQAQRSGSEWSADRDGADATCQAEAAAAGLPLPSSYRAFLGRDGGGATEGWSQPAVPFRNTCNGEQLAGTVDPWTAGFVFSIDATAPEHWPVCNAAGAPVAPPDLPAAGGDWIAAWWTFSTERGAFGGGDCSPGVETGTTGFAKAASPWHEPDLDVDGRPQPCATALPVLCLGVEAP